MPSPDFGELRSVKIDPELLSRGAGETLSLQEAIVYDYMPRILGSRFMGVDELRRATHFYSGMGSFMMLDEAYGEIAEQELKEGNLTAALEAYKRRLHAAVGFVSAMSMLGEKALLNKQEMNRLNLDGRFGSIEDKLTHAVVSQDIAFDLPKYIDWLKNIRRLDNESTDIWRLYAQGRNRHPDEPGLRLSYEERWDQSTVGNRDLGIKLRDLYVEMQVFGGAASICRDLGDNEGEAKYKEISKTDPVDIPRFQDTYRRINQRYDCD